MRALTSGNWQDYNVRPQPTQQAQQQSTPQFIKNFMDAFEQSKQDFMKSEAGQTVRQGLIDYLKGDATKPEVISRVAQLLPQDQKEEPEAKVEVEEKTDDGEYDWEYEYKPGDTFGQVLLDLGASDGSNLWGPAGDVAYYTQQLREQDMLDANGNVKLGKKFHLKKRPAGV